VFQLEGGIHRYLSAFPDDGGHWTGKNYTFDKRFSHGANKSEVISSCVHCGAPWDRYNGGKKCFKCAIEVLVCKACLRMAPPVKKNTLFCPLCKCN
jgi:predicted sulfurtransferase